MVLPFWGLGQSNTDSLDSVYEELIIGTWTLTKRIIPGAKVSEAIKCNDTIVIKENGSFNWKCSSLNKGTWEIFTPSSLVEQISYPYLILEFSGSIDGEESKMRLNILELTESMFTEESYLAIPRSGKNNPIHLTYEKMK
jgi:hypothetical protein